jgi:hypothetical protein
MKQGESAPGATQNAGGEATSVHFEGSRLVGSTAFTASSRSSA